MDIQALEARIKEIEATRDKFINEVNQQIGVYAGAISELQLWIDLEKKAAAEPKEPVSETLERVNKAADLELSSNGAAIN